MEHVQLLLNQTEDFDAVLSDPTVLPDGGDLRVITKDDGTKGGRPCVMLTFTVQLPDGSKARAQTVTTLGNFASIMYGLRGRYGEPPYPAHGKYPRS